MGDGTSVAKEASDITIIDNSFASIGRAVMWGRSLYRNIQRFILFQLTVNVVACLIVLSGSFLGMQSPLTVTQMLWVNPIMDTFAAMALASLPPTQSVMKEQPRSRSAFIINKSMWEFIIGAGLLFTVLLFALLYYLEHTDINSFDQDRPSAFRFSARIADTLRDIILLYHFRIPAVLEYVQRQGLCHRPVGTALQGLRWFPLYSLCYIGWSDSYSQPRRPIL